VWEDTTGTAIAVIPAAPTATVRPIQ